MAKLTATVESHPYRITAELRYHTGQNWQHLELETSAWFNWLTGNLPFRYTYTDRNYQQTLSFMVRPETLVLGNSQDYPRPNWSRLFPQ